MENAIEVKGLYKSFARFQIEDVNLNVKKGTVMGLIGPNGSGKTSIIKCIMGLNSIDKGEVSILGRDISRNPQLRNKIGYVSDDLIGMVNRSIDENIKMISAFYDEWNEEKFRFYTEKFKVDRYEKLKNLSKGQQMRYSLAMAFAHNPEILILDEPTAGLDAIGKEELLDILFELLEEKEITVIYSTHITGELEKIADYITLIDNGKIVFSRDRNSVFNDIKVVKGKLEELSEEVESEIIGIRRSKYGFEGLTRDEEKLKLLNKGLVFEEANLDKIIVGFSKGDK